MTEDYSNAEVLNAEKLEAALKAAAKRYPSNDATQEFDAKAAELIDVAKKRGFALIVGAYGDDVKALAIGGETESLLKIIANALAVIVSDTSGKLFVSQIFEILLNFMKELEEGNNVC